jgi:hypothetical protein
MTVQPTPKSRFSDLETVAVKTGQSRVPILQTRFKIVRKKNSM